MIEMIEDSVILVCCRPTTKKASDVFYGNSITEEVIFVGCNDAGMDIIEMIEDSVILVASRRRRWQVIVMYFMATIVLLMK
jgi:hypothetical protein